MFKHRKHIKKEKKSSSFLLLTLSLLFASFLIIPFICFSQKNIEPYIICDRIGDTIDQQEREYFFLFPGIEDFRCAKIYKLNSDSIGIKIEMEKRTGTLDTVLTVSEYDAQKLGEFVDNFELIFVDRLKISWKELKPCLIDVNSYRRKFSQLSNKYNEDEYDRFSIMNMDGYKYSGFILHVNDSLVVLWESDRFYDWRKLKEYSTIIYYNNIEEIIIERKGSFLKGARTGFLIGGSAGVLWGLASGSDSEGLVRFSAGTKALMGGLTLGVISGLTGGIIGAAKGNNSKLSIHGDLFEFKKVRPMLSKIAIFTLNIPPDLHKYISKKRKDNSEDSLMRNQAKQVTSNSIYKEKETVTLPDKANRVPEHESTKILKRKLHMSFSGSFFFTPASHNIEKAFNDSRLGGVGGGWFGSTSYPINKTFIIAWQFATEYNVSNKYRCGFSYTKFPLQEIRGISSEEIADGKSFDLFINYVPVTVDPLLISHFEYGLGIGVSYNAVSINGFVEEASFDIEKNLWGAFIRANLDYFLNTGVSLQLKIEARYVPKIDIGPISWTNDYTSETKTLVRHAVNFSSMNISFGLRFHL